jgi:hypothetical protein
MLYYILLMPRFKLLDSFVAKYMQLSCVKWWFKITKTIINSHQNDGKMAFYRMTQSLLHNLSRMFLFLICVKFSVVPFIEPRWKLFMSTWWLAIDKKVSWVWRKYCYAFISSSTAIFVGHLYATYVFEIV